MACVTQSTAETDETGWRDLALAQQREWVFVGAEWADAPYETDSKGLIRPHLKDLKFEKKAYIGQTCANADVHLAFNTAKAYSDLEAEFDFRFESATAGASFIFGAQDATNYYMAHIPTHGQTYRAKNFWATFSRMDKTGYLKVLTLQLVHGVVSELGMPLPGREPGYGLQLGIGPWHHGRLVVKGKQFRLWVDGRPGPEWRDEGYSGGRVGLETWSYHWRGAAFRNVRVRGVEIDAAPWDEDVKPPQNWRVPCSRDGKQQFCEGAALAPNGDLLFNAGDGLNRSTDTGKTWAHTRPTGWIGGWVMRTHSGRLASLIFRPDERRVAVSFSDDSGRSWSAYTQSNQITVPQGMKNMSNATNPFVEADDGVWLLFLLGGHESSSGTSSSNILQWGATHCDAMVVRSTDNGKTWSEPIAIDGYPAAGKNFDLTEPYAARLSDGRILCLIRPIYSPWMWETWSHDGGKTWAPTTRSSVTSYACAMLPHPTASGALVVGGRFPGCAVNVSRDNGMTWERYRIGVDLMCGGSMAEIAPDVVMWVFADTWRSSVRAHAIRITPTGIEPAPEYLPK